MMFKKLKDYLNEFATDPIKYKDDIGIKAIKTIVLELCKLNGESIWNHYNFI